MNNLDSASNGGTPQPSQLNNKTLAALREKRSAATRALMNAPKSTAALYKWLWADLDLLSETNRIASEGGE